MSRKKRNPVSRPNRDTRFSKDKSPYRTEIAAVFSCRGLEKTQAAGFFFRIHPDGAELIAGAFVPGSDELSALRRYIYASHDDFAALTTAKSLTSRFGDLEGDKLQRVPRGFDPAHPAAHLIRATQFYYRRALPKAVVTSKRFVPEIESSFRAATPFVEALDRALGNM